MDLLHHYNNDESTDDSISSSGSCQDKEEVQEVLVRVLSETEVSFDRVHPHREGQWSFHIYIPVSYDTEITKFITPLVRKELRRKSSDLPSSMDLVLHDSKPHVSLSNNLTVPHHVVHNLFEQMNAYIQTFPPFALYIHDLRCLTSPTRTYFVQSASDSSGVLSLLIQGIDRLLARYNLPSYPGDTHVSVASIECIDAFRNFGTVSAVPSRIETVNEVCVALGGQRTESIALKALAG